MPIIYSKTDDNNKLIVEKKLYIRSYSLELDKKYCVACGICQILCPTSAIKIKINTSVTQQLKVDIDEKKCIYCGICSALCPFSAFNLKIDGNLKMPLVENKIIPSLIHDVVIDNKKCSIAHTHSKEIGCVECEKVCPFKLIKINFKENGETNIEVDKIHCPGCQICVSACPYNLINVKKIFQGTIKINSQKCPEGCHLCLDSCPIKSTRKNALYILGGKVCVDERYCVYCGACVLVCPVNGAISFQRTFVLHNYVKSGTWNTILEKLTSHKNLTLELRTKNFLRLTEILSFLER